MCSFVLRVLSVLWAILVLAGVSFSNSHPRIKIRLLDSNGRESGLSYDGGIIEITCRRSWYCGDSDPRLWAEVQGGSRPVQNGQLPHQIWINSTTLSLTFSCSCGKLKSQKVQLKYALCNHRLVKPRKVCPDPGEFCQITKWGFPMCRSLNRDSCGHHGGDVSKLKVACTKRYVDEPEQRRYDGLCASLSNPDNPPPQFLATNRYECRSVFGVVACSAKCKQIVMSEWNFLDLDAAQLLTVLALLATEEDREIVCSAANSRDKVLQSKKVRLAGHTFTTIEGFAEELQKLSTPTIADIVCVVSENMGRRWDSNPLHSVYNTDALPTELLWPTFSSHLRLQDTIPLHNVVLQFQAYLLLFRSDTDLKYNVTIRDVETVGETVVYRLIISATSPEGFYVCLKENKSECHSSNMSNETKLETNATYEQNENNNFTITFYVGLFASSPKAKYVLVHEEIVTSRIDAPSPATSRTQLRDLIILGIVALAGVTICVVTAIIVAITTKIRKKMAKSHSPTHHAGKGAPLEWTEKSAPARKVERSAAVRKAESGPLSTRLAPVRPASKYSLRWTDPPSKIVSLASRTESYSLKFSSVEDLPNYCFKHSY